MVMQIKLIVVVVVETLRLEYFFRFDNDNIHLRMEHYNL